MLPFFGGIVESFTSWCLDSGLCPLTVKSRLAGLQRLDPWFRCRQKQRPEDLSAHDITQAYRFFHHRKPSLACAILMFGDFLEANHCLKPAPTLRRIKPGVYWQYRDLPLFGDLFDDFADWSQTRGYSIKTTSLQVDSLRWLVPWFRQRRKHSIDDVTADDLAEAWRYCYRRRPYSAGAVRTLGEMLKMRGRLRPGRPLPPTKSQAEIARFAEHLRTNLALANKTIDYHCLCLRRFYKFLKCDDVRVDWSQLPLSVVQRFICKMARHYSRRSMPMVVGTMRVFLRFQYMQGVLPKPLHLQLESVHGYRGERLPQPLPWPELQEVLRSMDRSTPIGARDFVMLLLAASYGLRRSEVAALTLDDIDWRSRTVRIDQIKTRQSLLLPLTDEVADALVNYLKCGRAASTERHLFLRHQPPAGPLGRAGVGKCLKRAVRATGVAIKTTNFHAVRHAFALRLLRQGTPLKHISEVMGHRDFNSTSQYLRLDMDDLRQVALSVPKLGKHSDGTGVKVQPKGPSKTRPMYSVTAPKRTGFQSFLARPMKDFLELHHALGRKYDTQRWVLRNLDFFLAQHVPNGRVFTAAMFENWTAEQQASVSPTVRCNWMRAVRKFCLYLVRLAPKTYVPASLMFPKQQPPKAPYLLSANEVARLLLAAVQKPRPIRTPEHPLRPHTMHLAVLLLYCCGLRRGELLNLRLGDWDAERRVLRINETKFHKSRLLPLSPSVSQEVGQYLQLRRDYQTPLQPSAPLFWSGRPGRNRGGFTANGLRFNWDQICCYAGVLNHHGHPPRIHDLRHSFAVAVLQRAYATDRHPQNTLPRLARYLGHSHFRFTHHYLKLTEPLQQAANDCVHQLIVADSIFQGGAL